jgi:hypothetical protein
MQNYFFIPNMLERVISELWYSENVENTVNTCENSNALTLWTLITSFPGKTKNGYNPESWNIALWFSYTISLSPQEEDN